MRVLILSFGIFLLLDSILTEIGIRLFNAIELNPFYNTWISLVLKIVLIALIFYKRDYFSNKDLVILNIVSFLIVINNSTWLILGEVL